MSWTSWFQRILSRTSSRRAARRHRPRRPTFFVEQLERRELLASRLGLPSLADGLLGFGPTALTAATPAPTPLPTILATPAVSPHVAAALASPPVFAPTAAVRRELVLVDTSTPNYEQLLDDLAGRRDPGTAFTLALIDGRADGVTAAATILAHYQDLDAIHVVSHGDPGELRLGSVTLNAANLDAYADSLRAWGRALKDSGDLMLYGCDVAATPAGQGFVSALAQLTGADVAASTNKTGSASQGGDWTLEYAVGPVETPVAFSAHVQSSWNYTLVLQTFATGSLIVDMGQTTQTIANSLKPYGLVYDMVTNYKVPVNWAINPAKTTFRVNPGDPIPTDFTATITTGSKTYAGGSFVIDVGFLSPTVVADINTWKAQGVVVDTLAAPLTTEIYGTITSFPRAVLDLQNGGLAVPYYANAGVPASSYRIGNPTDLTHCDDVYIIPHADPQDWSDAWKTSLYNFIDQGGGLWAGCHSPSAYEALTTVTIAGVPKTFNFLSNSLVPWTSHSDGTPPYAYNPAAANDPVMQILDRLDSATLNGSEQIFVPTTLDWRSTTTVAVFDPDQPNNPADGTSPYNKAAVIAYGNAFGDPAKGFVMYEAGHSLARATAAANVAAQRAFFNFILTQGINKAPKITATPPTIVPGQSSTITATISGGSGTYSYQWISTNGGIFSNPAGTWTVGSPPLTTQYQMTAPTDTIRLLITDVPCGRQSIWYVNVADAPPTIDLDGNNSSGAAGYDYKGYFQGGGALSLAADTDVLITDNGTTIASGTIKLTTRPDGASETLLIDQALAASYGISVTSDGAGGFRLSGTATLAQYQAVVATLQYVNDLPFPTSSDRVITVQVNDGISNSNTAVSRLSYLGGDVPTVNKFLYLSDPGQGMDRIDPTAAPVDNTTSSVAVSPVVINNSTGWATWSNNANKNLNYDPWTGSAFGTQGVLTTDSDNLVVMAGASSAKRNEAIVAGVTNGNKVVGGLWNGTSWVPIRINVGGTVTGTLGTAGTNSLWGAAVAYESQSGRGMLVWASGVSIYYSLWNGTSWTTAATIPTATYTGTDPRQLRLAANPLSASNEMVLVVTDKNEVDRALVWNGSAWGNQQQLDNDSGHNYTDINVAYESLSGEALVVYASGTSGSVGYRTWNGSAWSSAATLSNPSGTSSYARWTAIASDPKSNRIVLGVQTNGQDAWMNVWTGSAWGTATLGVTDTVDNTSNLEIAVAFESSSGEALAVYQNNAATELQYRSWSPGTSTWSSGTNFGSFGGNVARAVTLQSNPYSDQLMLMVNDDAKDLRSLLWSGSSFGTATTLDTDTRTTTGQPFTYLWDRYLPGTVTTTTTFTQTAAMTSPFVLPSGGTVKVTTYIQVTSGSLPATPKLGAALGIGSTSVLDITSTPTVTSLGGSFYKLEWTTTMPGTVTVATGESLTLTLKDYESGYNFNILYDSTTYPSKVQMATPTAIAVSGQGVYTAAYPGGSLVTTSEAGTPTYVRFTVSDPFGAADITGVDLVIKNAANTTLVNTSSVSVVASTASTKTYEYAWTPPAPGAYTITVTAHEGTEGVTAVSTTTYTATARPDLVVTKTDNGASLTPGGSVTYTLNYSNIGLGAASGVVLTETLPAGTTFNSAGSSAGWTPLGTSQYQYVVGNLAAGASGSVQFSVQVGATVPADYEEVQNSVTIADDGTHGADVNPNNNTGLDTTPVNAAPDLAVTKTDGGVSTQAGGVVLYQVTYSNVGNQDAINVNVEETLPANTTFNAADSTGDWDYIGGGKYLLYVGNLAAGASGTAIFAVTVNTPLVGVSQLNNSVTISDGGAGGADPVPGNNTATDTTPVNNNPNGTPQADLRVTKTDSLTSVAPGNLVTYTITVTNVGPTAVTGATFTDSVPATLTGVTFTASGTAGTLITPSSGSGNAITGLLNLPVGATVTYVVSGTLDLNASGTLTNVATIAPPAGVLDTNLANNTAVDEDAIVPVSDLSLAKTYTWTDLDGDGHLTAGDQIVFTLTLTNAGPNAAHNVSVMDRLPTGYLYVSDDAASSGGTYSSGSGLWTIGTVGGTAPNNTAVLHITATVYDGGNFTNAAEVWSSDSADPDSTPHNYVTTEDDYAAVTPPVQPKSDLSLTKTLTLTTDVNGNGVIEAGDQVTFTLVVSNAGPNAAANVHVGDLLPAGYSFVSYTVSAGGGSYTSGTGDWNVGTLNVLGSATLAIQATVVGGQAVSAYTNYAQVTASDSFDPDSTPNNNATSEDDYAAAAPAIADLSLTKTVALAPDGDLDGSGTFTVNDQVVFTITVSNTGPDFATGVQVKDLLPAAFTYVDDDAGGAYNSATGLWTVGALAAGSDATLNITATITASGTNTAQVSASGQFDPDSTPNNSNAAEDDQASVAVNPGATAVAPVAVNDSSLGNPAGPVTLNVTDNDTDANLDLNVATVDLDPATAGQQTTRTVAGQGTWTVDSLGNVTFTPQAGFTQDPTPISYTVQDSGARTSNQATITIDYVPVATDDSSSGNTTGTPVTVNVLANDTTGDTVNPTTVQIVGTPAPGASLVVPGEGTWSVNTTTGAITFTPQAGFTGDPTPIQYTVKDHEGNVSNPATVTIDYNQLPPVANNDSSLHNPAGAVTLNVTGNDTDPNNDLDVATVDLDPATAGRQTLYVAAGQGTWTVDNLGNVTFTPQVGFTGDPTPIPYTVQDKTGLTSNQATITVDYVPVAADDSSSGNTTGTAVTVNVLANDTAGDTAVPATVQIVGTASPGASLVVPGEGTWTVNTTTGAITFTPQSGFTGDPTPIHYTVQDNDGNVSNQAKVTIDYNQFPPVANNDASHNNPPGAVTLNVTGNDTDPNNDLDVATVDLDPATPGRQTTLTVAGQGAWTVNAAGDVTFTPQAGFTHDPTPIPYTVQDRTGLTSNQATITIDYKPVAANDSSSGNTTGTPVTVNVLANDTAGDTAVPATVQIVGTASPGSSLVVPGQGTWSVNTTTGAITFTPEPGYTGDPTPITYTVKDAQGNVSNPATVTVDYTQFPPVANNDSSLGNPPGAVTLNVTGNDTDPNNDLDVATVDLDPATPGRQTTLTVAGQGTWTVNAAGDVTFTPQAGFTQDPTPITYTVNDKTGLTSNVATITVDYKPVAANDSSSGNTTGTPVTVSVLANDTTGDTAVPATVQIVGTANPGDPLVVPGEGTWTVNTTTGAITFTPQAGFTGDPTPIQYTVQDNDGNVSNPATVTVDYTQFPPVANNDSSLGNPPGAVTLNVTGNDTDPNGDLDVATVDLDPATPGRQTTLTVAGQGAWTVNAAGDVTFTPQAGFTHDPTPIPYTVQDRTGLTSNQATITVDYKPVAANDSSSGNTTGTAVTVNVLANDTAGDTAVPATVQIVGTASPGSSLVVPGEGTWSVNTTTGAITFTPQAGFTGDPTPITYTVQDNDGNVSNPATVTVDYTQFPPVANNDSSPNNPPGAVTLNVTGNDTDPNNDLDVATVDLDPATPGRQTSLIVAGEGTWTVDAAGNVTFTPQAGFTHDPTPIPYTVNDKTGLTSNQATITIDYRPVATDDSSTGNTPPGVTVVVDVLANDTTGDTVVPTTVVFVNPPPGSTLSPDGKTLTVPGEGTWTVNPTTGAITFTPEAGFTTNPSPVYYTVQDDDGCVSNPAKVTVTYGQLPVAVDDSSLGNPAGPVTLNVTGNDSAPGSTIDPATVDLDPATAGQQTTLTVAGQGTWTVDAAGDVTFTPQVGFTHDPTPIPYTVQDTRLPAGTSNQATITIDYVPVAADDSSSGHTTGTAVTVNVLANDTTGDTAVPATVQIVGTASPGASLVVPGEGTWSVNTTTGAITFTPQAGFTADPTPIHYTVKDNDGNVSNTAKVTVDYLQLPPVANNDSSTGNVPGPVTLNVTGNDTDPNNDLDVATVDLDPATPGRQTTLTVVGQGTWTVNAAGDVTFTPQAGFTQDPTPITYTVDDKTGLTSNQATITIDYKPVATNDSSSGNTTGTPVTVSVLANDTTGDTAVPATVQIVGTANPGDPLVVPGEGTWTVNTTTGAITFTPQAGFTGDPTPIQYTVQDNDGNVSNPASVTVDYTQFPPVANNDSSLGNPPGAVTLNVTGNDTDPNSDLDVATVDLDPATPGRQTTLTVAGQGTWTVNAAGDVTFTPQVGFTHDPTPIPYTVQDRTGLTSNQATITVDYKPVAANDTSSGNTTGSPAVVDVLANDTVGDTAVPSTVQIGGTASPGSSLVVPGEGTWSVNTTTGAITFTPQAGFTGDPTPITYTVKDNDGNVSNPATVTVTYSQFPPVANNDSSLNNPPGAVTLNVTGNDTDPNNDLDPATVDLNPAVPGQQTTLTVAGQGTWTVDGAGNVTFTPLAGFTGDPTPIPYTVNDRTGLTSNQATITVDYKPVAVNDSSTGNPTGSPVIVNVLANDTAGDTPNPATVQIVGTANPGDPLVVPGEGTWTVNTTTGAITFTPQAGFTGDPTPISYTVKDYDGSTSDPATVTVDYTQLPPVANNDSSLGNLPGPVTLNATGNDTDPNNDLDPATVDLDPAAPGRQTTLTVAGEGTWTVNAAGDVTFTPQAGFTGDPTPIPYTVQDRTNLTSNQATITVDYMPVATNDSSSGNTTGTPVTVNVLANDTTGDTAVPATVQIVGTANPGDPLVVPGEGTWTVNTTTGAITFTPQAGFTGDPTPIQYTVKDNDGNVSNPASVTLDYTQLPPVANNDSSPNNPAGPVTLNVTGNDTDPNGDLDPATVDLDPAAPGRQTTLTVAGEGTWTVNAAGDVTFTPQAGFTHDPTPIPYTVNDRTGLTSNQATITVDYKPVATNDVSNGNAPSTPITVDVLANDTTGDSADPTTVQIVGTANPGDPLVVPGEGTWTVNPTTGAITFTPQAGFTGNPSPIQYTVKDDEGNLSNPATVTVYVVPVAANDSSTGNTTGSPVTVNVLTNDTAGETPVPSTVQIVGTANPGDPLVVPGEGTWTVNTTTGAITFTPQSGFTGDPTPITYTVQDAQGNVSNTATVTVDYTQLPPVANNDSSTGNVPGPVTLNVTGNDTDPDNDLNPATVDLDPSTPGVQDTTRLVAGEGTWTVNAAGDVTFTPAAGFTGDPTPITYTVKDRTNLTSNQATITVDYKPVATNDSSSGNTTGTPVTVNVLANDTTGDTAVPSTVRITGTPAPGSSLVVPGEGTWSVNTTTGAITFTPQAGFTGDPTPITYTVQDNDGNVSNPATVTVDYTQLPPTANNDSKLNNPPGAVTLNVTNNDTDPNGDLDPATVDLDPNTAGRQTSLTVAGQGAWSVGSLGNVTFTPQAGYTKDPTPIPYTVNDRTGLTSNQATITVDYAPVTSNDSSTANAPGTTVTLNVLANDTRGDTTVATTVVFVNPPAGSNLSPDKKTLTVPSQGTWRINTTTGIVTFTPIAGYTGNPTPVQYTVQDAQGNVSAPATVTVAYYRNITSQLSLVRCGLFYNWATGRNEETVNVTNTSSSTITGPIRLLVRISDPRVTLFNKSGTSQSGFAYINVNVASLAPGQKTSVKLEFANPSRIAFSYTLEAYTGDI